MSQKKNTMIKYLLIGDLDNCFYIGEFSINQFDAKVKKDSKQIFTKICQSGERKFDERNKIAAGENNYFFTLMKPNIVFLIYASNECPERIIFALIEDIKNEGILSMINALTKELNPTGKKALQDLIERYQDKTKYDKISAIQEDVNVIKKDIKNNINNMVESVEDAQKLQNQAQALKESSEQYKNNSAELKKLAWWHNFKVWLIIILIFLLAFGILFWFFFK